MKHDSETYSGFAFAWRGAPAMLRYAHDLRLFFENDLALEQFN
jgi:hypothetical protein